MFKALVFGAAFALAPLAAGAATLGVKAGDPFLGGSSEWASSDGAYADGNSPDGIWVLDLGWTGLGHTSQDEYGLGFGFLVHPDDTVSSLGFYIDGTNDGKQLLQSYTLGGFGFTADTLEFLLTDVISDEPWVSNRVLVTLALLASPDFSNGPSPDFSNGVYAALLGDLRHDDFLGLDNIAGYDTDIHFANVLPTPVPVPAGLPLLLSGLALLWTRKRSAPA